VGAEKHLQHDRDLSKPGQSGDNVIKLFTAIGDDFSY
jgi:hypothetical protein